MDTCPWLYPEAKHSWYWVNICWMHEYPFQDTVLLLFLKSQSEYVLGEYIHVSEWRPLYISLWTSESVDFGVINSLVASFHFCSPLAKTILSTYKALKLVKITWQTYHTSLTNSVKIKKSRWAELKEDTGKLIKTQHANIKSIWKAALLVI